MGTKDLQRIIKCSEKTDRNEFYMKKGNIEIKRNKFQIIIKYFGNTIMVANIYYKKDFTLYYCGYYKHCSTTIKIKFLEKYYKEKGYKYLGTIL